MVTAEELYRRTLTTVRELVTLSPDAFSGLLARMQASPAAGGLVARAANRHLAKSDREASGVLSAAQRHTHFLDSARMGRVMARSDFGFSDLKAGTATVYLVLPPDRLDAHGRWLRLMVGQAITAMARSPARPPLPRPVPARRVRGARLPGAGRARDGAHGRLRSPALAHPPGPAPAARHLRRARGHVLANAGITQVFNVNDTAA